MENAKDSTSLFPEYYVNPWCTDVWIGTSIVLSSFYKNKYRAVLEELYNNYGSVPPKTPYYQENQYLPKHRHQKYQIMNLIHTMN